MPNKSDRFYYDSFVEISAAACEAAAVLETMLRSGSAPVQPDPPEQFRRLRQRSARRRREVDARLHRAFVTPMERGDIMDLCRCIDTVTCAVADIAAQLSIHNITAARPEAAQFPALLTRCCRAVRTLLEELPGFRRSQTLGRRILALERLREEGRQLYHTASADLHRSGCSARTLLTWGELYGRFDAAFRACGAVADVVARIVVTNA